MRASASSSSGKIGNVLFIVDQGGYPVNLFARELAERGYEVNIEQSMRRALSRLKSMAPDVVVTEFNYTTHFRDRVSNLEPLLARLQGTAPNARVVAFLEKEHAVHLDKLRARFPIAATVFYPLGMEQLLNTIQSLFGE